ncbi:MAG: hypothetical protein HY900_33000 [Deltaproteobacteria bacterium]|nr:hypothetical protein [Deltaproteobacteria bacterium]
MAKRILSALLLGLVTLTSLAGCYATGRATGEAAKGVEQGAQEFKEGYQEGRTSPSY